MPIGLHHLRYFVAVAEEGHVTRAATRLHLSQPSLSAQIRYLEEQVGVELFARHPRGMTLTPAGEAFAAVVALAPTAGATRTSRHARQSRAHASHRQSVTALRERRRRPGTQRGRSSPDIGDLRPYHP